MRPLFGLLALWWLMCGSSARIASGAPLGAAEPPVVSGSPAPRGRWPDAVFVRLREGTCTGTLVAPDVVLTAARCIEGGPIEVAVDTVDHAAPGGERIGVAWARAYPDWQHSYDAGVIVLERPARPPPRRVAAGCTARERVVAGGMITIAGFGLAAYGGTGASTRLHEATVAITDPRCTRDAACRSELVPHGEIAAGGHGADACFGDSGGPVYVDAPGGPALLGIVSRGLAVPAMPCGGGGVYVRADRVAAWAQSVTGRRLERTSCRGDADGAPGAEPGDDAGGCAAGGGADGAGASAMAAVALAIAVTLRRRGSRRSRRVRDDGAAAESGRDAAPAAGVASGPDPAREPAASGRDAARAAAGGRDAARAAVGERDAAQRRAGRAAATGAAISAARAGSRTTRRAGPGG